MSKGSQISFLPCIGQDVIQLLRRMWRCAPMRPVNHASPPYPLLTISLSRLLPSFHPPIPPSSHPSLPASSSHVILRGMRTGGVYGYQPTATADTVGRIALSMDTTAYRCNEAQDRTWACEIPHCAVITSCISHSRCCCCHCGLNWVEPKGWLLSKNTESEV